MLDKAKKILLEGGYTCTAVFGDEVFTSKHRGISPLIEWYSSAVLPKGFSAADKAVGKGVAFLYVLLGAKEVYSPLMSTPAIEVLKKYGIMAYYDTEVAMIKNRAKDGFCPMELATKDIDDPLTALKAMLEKRKELADKNEKPQ